MKIGIISDTHGLLRPEVLTILQDCDVILHGGDINRQNTLDQLESIAPVYVVRGNNDREWAEHIPMYLDFELSGLRVFMTHKKKDLPKDLSAYDLVIYGHSHKYEESYAGNTLLLNPGSCGLRRFNQSITMAVMETELEGGGSDHGESVGYAHDFDTNACVTKGFSLNVRGINLKVTRIEIPHAAANATVGRGLRSGSGKPVINDLSSQIEIVIREIEKGHGVRWIASRYQIDEALVEQIARLYLTHPGVTVEGILNKMGV